MATKNKAKSQPRQRHYLLKSKTYGEKFFTYVIQGDRAALRVWWDEGCGFSKIIGAKKFASVTEAREHARDAMRRMPWLVWEQTR